MRVRAGRPAAGGAWEFAEPDVNAIVCDTRDEATVCAAVERLVEDPSLRARLKEAGVATAGALLGGTGGDVRVCPVRKALLLRDQLGQLPDASPLVSAEPVAASVRAPGHGLMTLLGRALSRDASYYTLAMASVFPLGIATALVTTRYLDPAEYGRLGLLMIFASFATIVYGLGVIQGTLMWAYAPGWRRRRRRRRGSGGSRSSRRRSRPGSRASAGARMGSGLGAGDARGPSRNGRAGRRGPNSSPSWSSAPNRWRRP